LPIPSNFEAAIVTIVAEYWNHKDSSVDAATFRVTERIENRYFL